MSDYHPLGPDATEDPYPAYATLRGEAPVYPIPGLGLLAVSRHADVVRVLRHPELFSSSPMRAALRRPESFVPEEERERAFEPQTLIGSDPPVHTRMRKLANRGFTPARVAALEPRVREIAVGLADRFVPKGECDLVADYAVPLPLQVIAELLGVDPERRDDFRRWSDAMVRAAFDPIPAQDEPHVLQCIRELGAYFEEVIEERRRAPRDDLISAFALRGAEDETFTPDEVTSLVGTLLVAGNVTTRHLIANAMLALIRNPREWARACAERALVPRMVEEALRYDSPVQLIPRATTCDVELSAVSIPKGAVLAVLLGSANRDERAFPDPDRFDVARDASAQVAFGLGAHFCLGAPLARLEARVAFEILLARIRRPELVVERPRRAPSLILRGPAELLLAFEPRL